MHARADVWAGEKSADTGKGARARSTSKKRKDRTGSGCSGSGADSLTRRTHNHSHRRKGSGDRDRDHSDSRTTTKLHKHNGEKHKNLHRTVSDRTGLSSVSKHQAPLASGPLSSSANAQLHVHSTRPRLRSGASSPSLPASSPTESAFYPTGVLADGVGRSRKGSADSNGSLTRAGSGAGGADGSNTKESQSALVFGSLSGPMGTGTASGFDLDRDVQRFQTRATRATRASKLKKDREGQAQDSSGFLYRNYFDR